MYWILTLILIIGALLILIIMIQNPKGGLAANFSSSNQIMGARQTTDFLEKATWTLGIALVILSIATSFMMSNSSQGTIQNQSIMQKEINQAATPINNQAINKNIPMPDDVQVGS